MTTLVALATKDALVMGADSLATVTRDLVDPFDLMKYFDPANGFVPRIDEEGRPLLGSFFELFDHAQTIPYNQIANVRKLFSLETLPIGVMFTGITSIGDRTIGGLIGEFRDQLPSKDADYTVESVAKQLLDFLRAAYTATFAESSNPSLELLIGGYDHAARLPCVWRVTVHRNEMTPALPDEARFGIAFAGQMDWIQRIVFGTDTNNLVRVAQRNMELLKKYRDLAEAGLREIGNAR